MKHFDPFCSTAAYLLKIESDIEIFFILINTYRKQTKDFKSAKPEIYILTKTTETCCVLFRSHNDSTPMLHCSINALHTNNDFRFILNGFILRRV